MITRVALHVGLVAVMMMLPACGENVSSVPTGPTGPPSLSLSLQPRIEGVWGGPITLTSVAAGTGPGRAAGAFECVGAAFDAIVGETIDHSLSITRTSTGVTAKLVSAGTGLACSYSGLIGSSNTLILNASSCDAPELFLRCPPDINGNVVVRRLDLVGSSITATFDPPVNVTSITGTAAHTYNLIDEEGKGVGTLVANHSFTNLRRR